MHSESRRWFYGLQQPLTDEQAEVLRGLMDEFVGQWKAHGAQLPGHLSNKGVKGGSRPRESRVQVGG